MLEMTKERSQSDINLTVCKTTLVSEMGAKNLKGPRMLGITYGIPMHCLEPFENGTRYLSSFLEAVGFSQR